MTAEELAEIEDRIPPIYLLDLPGEIEDPDRAVVPFVEYPLTQGWTLEQQTLFLRGEPPSSDYNTILPMLQRWLFFGFLESAYQRRFLLSDYVFSSPSGRVIKTMKLREVIYQHWTACKLDNFGEEARKRVNQVWLNATQMNMFYFYLLNLNSSGSLELFDSEVFHSSMRLAAVVGQSVYDANTRVSCHFQRGLNRHLMWPHTTPNQGALIRRLKSGGWCPSLLDTFEHRGICFAEIASVMEPTASRTKISKVIETPNSEATLEEYHKFCKGIRCEKERIELGSTIAEHVHHDCDCHFLKPHLQTMLEIIDRGHIALVDLRELLNTITGQSSSAIEWTETLSYITVSHVWSDGLVGCTETGLPTCQLQRILTHVDQMTKNGLVWIDSLCIPSNPDKKLKVIGMMADIYRSSTATVVYDAGLQSESYDIEVPTATFCIRFFTSRWIHRLWTLQECVLAKQIVLAFKDVLVPLNPILKRIVQNVMYPIESLLLPDLGSLLLHQVLNNRTLGMSRASYLAATVQILMTSHLQSPLFSRSRPVHLWPQHTKSGW